MAGYQKKVAYLDYLENGMKIKNAGFVKAEENNGQMRLEMRVKNIPESFSGEYELKADTGGTIGRISLGRGSGGCCVIWKNGNKAPEGKKMVTANGIYIRLPGRHLLQAIWNEPMEVPVEREEEERLAGERPEDNGSRPEDAVQRPVEQLRQEPVQRPVEQQRQEPVQRPAEQFMPEEMPTEDRRTEQPEPELQDRQQTGPGTEQDQRTGEIFQEGREQETSVPVFPSWEMAFESDMRINSMPPETLEPKNAGEKNEESQNRGIKKQESKKQDAEPVCYGDKWEQLSHTYPVIHPFQDEREYLSVAPKDFVVLRQDYQKMVHNSFLLHGYYNYKHLILGKIREADGWSYYLGVPGNFYNREKMVAEMFGFEAFEGEKTPAEPGDFGYFMKKVDI